jgi:hypothetical protein
VILFDPIFQGLAISLMAGEVASLLLSRMTVPVLFYMSERKKHERPPVELIPPSESPEGTEIPSAELPVSSVESVPVVESEADVEPATGNESRADGESDPASETSDAANRVDDDESPDNTNSA